MLCVASLVFRAPRALYCGPGRCVCWWAAVFLLVVCYPDRSPAAARPTRPLAVRAASFARRVGSKPGQAPQASRRPPIGRGLSLVCCRPGPATAHRHRVQAPSIPQDSHPVVTSYIPEPTPNSACNSPTTLSNPEIRLAELQRFQTLLKLHPIEVHASFLRGGCIGAAAPSTHSTDATTSSGPP